MEAYIPDTLLLNNIYIPFYIPPTKQIYNCKVDYTLEIDGNGITSIINLNNDFPVPFFNISRYDVECRDWFWYDRSGLPFRLVKSGSDWKLTSVYRVGEFKDDQTLIIDPTSLRYDSYGKELGFYSLVNGNKFYTGAQLILEIGGYIVKDQTNYYGNQMETILTNLNTDVNKEFYYSFNLNKIFTNQNLSFVDPAQIKIYMYNLSNSISIKSRTKGNYGMNNFVTPTVDYYIAKLHGQLLKG